MKRYAWIFLFILCLAAPSALSAQGLAVGARAGTLGLGGEVAYGLNDMIVLRGGFGVFPYEYDATLDDQDYTVTFPTSIWSAGVDLYLGGGPIRIMGGMMGRSGDLEVKASWTGSREIGDVTYNVPGSLKGTLEQSSVAPFVGIGFGKHTAGGLGFFLDLAVAFTGEPDVKLTPGGAVASEPDILTEVQKEADKIKDDAGSYINYWPILSIGFKIPLSGRY
jgi:hypothetical protein